MPRKTSFHWNAYDHELLEEKPDQLLEEYPLLSLLRELAWAEGAQVNATSCSRRRDLRV